jgi:hypothetical protein
MSIVSEVGVVAIVVRIAASVEGVVANVIEVDLGCWTNSVPLTVVYRMNWNTPLGVIIDGVHKS